MDWKLLAFEIGIFLLISLVITLAGYGYSLYLAIMSLQEVQTVSGAESGEVFRQNLKYALVGSGIVGVSVACLIWGLLAPEPRKPLPREEDERFR
ncbi:hypothetical protein [Pseudovibrio flavus]|uniref:hypothetical protein n=1 Tax=Pseudovibrio flavus TaxID=2529854 RepID=UPI0012BBB61F|nr:hypothetical protein [Pseudovibrio flavus]